jgi:hypothetical protein
MNPLRWKCLMTKKKKKPSILKSYCPFWSRVFHPKGCSHISSYILNGTCLKHCMFIMESCLLFGWFDYGVIAPFFY